MRLRVLPPWLAARQLAKPVHIAPKLLERQLRDVPDPEIALMAVYSRKNGPTVAKLVDALPGAQFGLWALDEPAPELERHTRGVGRGQRSELLNRMLPDIEPSRHLIITDDDVAMPASTLRLFARASAAAGLDLAQPAHVPLSHTSWPFVQQRLRTYVRLTRFVEQGPLILLSPRGRAEILPLPEELGMGWGLEALWARKEQDGLRLGIVDATGMRHLQAASSYDTSEQDAIGRQVLRDNGFSSYGELQVVTDEWRVGQPAPDWVDGKPA